MLQVNLCQKQLTQNMIVLWITNQDKKTTNSIYVVYIKSFWMSKQKQFDVHNYTACIDFLVLNL